MPEEPLIQRQRDDMPQLIENAGPLSTQSQGWVYILGNESIPGQLKIGKTIRAVAERSSELSGATGVPTKFEVLHQRFFENCHSAEQKIHRRLEEAGHRTSQNREFFKVDLQTAVDLLDSMADAFENETAREERINEALVRADEFLNGSARRLVNKASAVKCLEEAAELGNTDAMIRAGLLEEELKHLEKAMYWYTRAVDQDDSLGMFYAGALLSRRGQIEDALENWTGYFVSQGFRERPVEIRVLHLYLYVRACYDAFGATKNYLMHVPPELTNLKAEVLAQMKKFRDESKDPTVRAYYLALSSWTDPRILVPLTRESMRQLGAQALTMSVVLAFFLWLGWSSFWMKVILIPLLAFMALAAVVMLFTQPVNSAEVPD